MGNRLFLWKQKLNQQVRSWAEMLGKNAVEALRFELVYPALHDSDFSLCSDPRRWGVKWAEDGGKRGKKRAVIAVA